MTNLKSLYRAVVHDEREPPKGVITGNVSDAVQAHEVAIAKFNKVACSILHGDECHCYEKSTAP